MTEPAHSRYGGSAAARIMACPASVRLGEEAAARGCAPTVSKYAEAGTKAHALLEICMTVGVDTFDVIGDYTAEMRSAVQQTVMDLRNINTVGPPQIEQRVNPFADVDDCFGTADYAALALVPGPSIVVVDFKYGKGVKVSPESNPQLLFYALGASRLPQYSNVETAWVGISQPRLTEGIQWFGPLTACHLEQWGEQFRSAISRADTEAPTPGKHCRWCPGRAVCPAKTSIDQVSPTSGEGSADNRTVQTANVFASFIEGT